MTAQELHIGAVPVRALRISYVGELGWEIYAPTEYGLALWDMLWGPGSRSAWSPAAARPTTRCGWRRATGCGARTSTRSTTRTRPASAGRSAGQGRVHRPRGAGGARSAGARRRLRCLVLDDPAVVLVGKEPILDGDAAVGYVTSAALGSTVGQSIAYGYLPVERAEIGTRLEVYVEGERHGVTVAAEPLFDPRNERLRERRAGRGRRLSPGQRVGRRGDAGRRDEHDEQRRAQQQRDRGGGDAGQPRVDDSARPSPTVWPTTSAASRQGASSGITSANARGSGRPAKQRRAGALDRDRGGADERRRRSRPRSSPRSASAMTAPAAAATIGRPGGSSGVSASAISAAGERRDAGAARVELADQQREEERGEHRVEAVVGRVAERAAAEHAGDRPRDPGESSTSPAPISRSRSTRPPSLRDRPRLVDRELGLGEPARRPAAQRRRDRDADREVAQVEQHGRGDRGGHRAAGVAARTRRRTAPSRRTWSATSRSARRRPSRRRARGSRTTRRRRATRDRDRRRRPHAAPRRHAYGLAHGVTVRHNGTLP